MSKIDKEIGMRLKIARKSYGYKTAIEFYQSTDIPKSTYSQHESGNRSLTADLILKYAELLEISPSWLLTGIGHPCPTSKNRNSRKDSICNEVRKLQDKKLLPITSNFHLDVSDSSASINMELFCKILIPAMECVNTNRISISAEEFVKFCVEIYNNIEPLDVPIENKGNIINLSINSLVKANKIVFKQRKLSA